MSTQMIGVDISMPQLLYKSHISGGLKNVCERIILQKVKTYNAKQKDSCESFKYENN